MQKASEAKIAIRAVDDQVTICANCGLHATIAYVASRTVSKKLRRVVGTDIDGIYSTAHRGCRL